jgi:hypothetical protein
MLTKTRNNLIRRIASHNLHALPVVAGLTTIVMLALGSANTAQAGKKSGGGNPQVPPLCLTFRDDVTDAIQSDGKGDYCDGSSGIVQLNNWGMLGFETSLEMSRWVNSDFSDPVDDEPEPLVRPFEFGTPVHLKLVTKHALTEETTDSYGLLSLLDIEKGTSRAHGTLISFETAEDWWRLDFGLHGGGVMPAAR